MSDEVKTKKKYTYKEQVVARLGEPNPRGSAIERTKAVVIDVADMCDFIKNKIVSISGTVDENRVKVDLFSQGIPEMQKEIDGVRDNIVRLIKELTANTKSDTKTLEIVLGLQKEIDELKAQVGKLVVDNSDLKTRIARGKEETDRLSSKTAKAISELKEAHYESDKRFDDLFNQQVAQRLCIEGLDDTHIRRLSRWLRGLLKGGSDESK